MGVPPGSLPVSLFPPQAAKAPLMAVPAPSFKKARRFIVTLVFVWTTII
jgi:hypothetical protein